MKLEYDPETNQAYLYLKEPVGDGESVEQVVCDDEALKGDIVIDLDRDGRVLGFEFTGAARAMLPPSLLDADR